MALGCCKDTRKTDRQTKAPKGSTALPLGAPTACTVFSMAKLLIFRTTLWGWRGAQQLRALALLTEDLRLVPNTHTAALNHS